MTHHHTPAPVLLFQDVSFAYDKALVLNNVCCSINQGEFIGIIGPNGGGKTTFLKLVMGFLLPQKGSIQLFGRTPLQERNKIAYVPQNLRFDKKFPISVMELVLSGLLSTLPFYGKYSKKDKEKCAALLDTMGLLHLKDRSIGTLSGGQMQRALIGRALIGRPQLLLLDEPTANVDSQAEHEIYNLLKTLSSQMTIAMVTHDLKTSINLVDRVLCIQTGATMYKASEVCEHFALGLYHSPLLIDPKNNENRCSLQVEKNEN